MRIFLLNDSINQLHWNMLKSIVMILAILPLNHVLLNIFQNIDGSSRIIFGFLYLSLLSASCIIAFTVALRSTTWVCLEAKRNSEKVLFNLYKHVPILFFTAIIITVISKV